MRTQTVVGRSDIEERLVRLRLELRNGEAQLAAMEARRRETAETMLRITGAIQVLEELLQSGETAGAAPPDAIVANGTKPLTAEV